MQLKVLYDKTEINKTLKLLNAAGISEFCFISGPVSLLGLFSTIAGQ
jgi:hypothetical protein